MRVAGRASVYPRGTTRPPLCLGISDEGTRARLAVGEVEVGAVWSRVSLLVAGVCRVHTSWPRAVPPRRAKAKAQGRGVGGGVPNAVTPGRGMRGVLRAFDVAIVEGDAAASAHVAGQDSRWRVHVRARGIW